MANLPYRYPNFGPFFVSPSGSDGGGSGSSGNPWRQPQAAIDHISAANLNQVQRGDITINLLPGTYSDFSFSELDGGGNGHRIIVRPTGAAGSPHVSLGTAITGWSHVSGSIYRAPIVGDFQTVYVDGARARAARYPKVVVDPLYPQAQAPWFRSLDNGSTFDELKYLNSDFDPAAWNLADLQAVVMSGGAFNWLTDTHTVIARDTTAKTLTFGEQGKFYTYRGGAGSFYFLQNVIEFLTELGEFYVDRVNGYLYMYGDPAGSDVIVPTGTQAVTANGASARRPVRNVTIDGLTIEHTDFLPTFRFGYTSNAGGTIFQPPGHTDTFYGYWDSLPAARHGAVTVKNADGVKVTRCHLKNIGTNGYYAGEYGANLEFSQILLEQLGMSAVVQEGGYCGEGDRIGGSFFYSIRARRFGELAAHATGIQIGNSGSNIIRRYHVSDARRHGTWLYGSYGQPPENCYARDNLFEYGLYEDLCQGSGDDAAMYMESLSSRAGESFNVNEFRQFIIRRIHTHPFVTDAPGDGVYTDNQTRGQVFEDGEVEDVDGQLLRINDSGDADVTNCSFLADGSEDPSFDPDQIDRDNIGVANDFPYDYD